LTVAAESEPRASIFEMCIVESIAPSSGTEPACEPGASPSAAYAESVSPRAIESKYCRTTFPASFENSPSESNTVVGALTAAGVAGAAVAGTAVGAAEGTRGASVAANVGANVTGRCRTAMLRGVAVTSGDCVGTGALVTFATVLTGAGVDVRAGLASADADADAAGEGDVVPVTLGRGEGLGLCDIAGSGAGVLGRAVAVALGSGSGDDVATTATSGEPCFPTTESPAPITKPSTTTPMKIGMNGSDEPPLGGFGRDRRRGVSSITECGSRQEDAMLAAKRARVVRIAIPIDIGTISETECCAFALATPIRVDRLLALAVQEALGARAPADKRERGIRTTLSGFAAGKFVVDIDGRIFDRPDAVVVCSGFATLRFFSAEPQWRSLPSR